MCILRINPDFFWDSTFIECLVSGEKKKYQNFNLSSFDLNQYKAHNCLYNENIPYFSDIVRFVVYSKCIRLLKNDLKFYQTPNIVNVKNLSPAEEKPAIKKTFDSNFDEQQIEILTCCINKARIFTESMTSETVTRIFKCELTKPLRVKNNRRLAYFFVSLDDRSLMTIRNLSSPRRKMEESRLIPTYLPNISLSLPEYSK
jgi:hypothetical protein